MKNKAVRLPTAEGSYLYALADIKDVRTYHDPMRGEVAYIIYGDDKQSIDLIISASNAKRIIDNATGKAG